MNPFRSKIGTLNEILFEKKNKLYGAYAIRSAYGSTVFKALGITSSAMLGTAWFLSLLLGKVAEVKIPQPDDAQLVKEIVVNLEELKEIKKPVAADKPKSVAAAVDNSNLNRYVIKDKPADSVKTVINDPINPVGSGSTSTGTETTTIGTTGGSTLTTGGGETGGEATLFPEIFPSFPGGLKAFWASNVRYPRDAREQGVEGKVVVNFVIDQEGKVASCQVTQGIGYGCDEEVLRVVKLMPRWKPGMIGGQPVKVSFKQVVEFKLK